MAAKAISRGGKAVSVGGKWLATNAAGESPRCCCCCQDPPDSLYITLTAGETVLPFLLTRDDTDIPEGCTQQWVRDETSTCDYDCADDLWIRCCGGKYWLYVNEDDPIELTMVACDPFELTATATVTLCGLEAAEYAISATEGPCPDGCCDCEELPETVTASFSGTDDLACLDGLEITLTKYCQATTPPSDVTIPYYETDFVNIATDPCNGAGHSWQVSFLCNGGGEWTMNVLYSFPGGGGCVFTLKVSEETLEVVSCDPVHLIGTIATDAGSCAPLPEGTFTIEVTE